MHTEMIQEALLKERTGAMMNLGMKADALSALGRVGEEDQAQVSYDEFVSLQLNGIEYKKLKLVNEALRRLSVGEYGLCFECEEAIPQRRLQVVPWAKYCVPCQEEITRREAEERLAQSMGFSAQAWESAE